MNGIVTISDAVYEKKYIPLEHYEKYVEKVMDPYDLQHIINLCDFYLEARDNDKDIPWVHHTKKIKQNIKELLKTEN